MDNSSQLGKLYTKLNQQDHLIHFMVKELYLVDSNRALQFLVDKSHYLHKLKDYQM